MEQLSRDFVSTEDRSYPIKIGRVLASALTGFIAGAIVASMIWMVAFYYINNIVLQ
ncbi:MAG: hypothetical protein O2794_03920 [bacterium]|nr:hypothetical protein [bacterium]